MGQALYRKYRSKNLSEIIGQEHITNALSKALTTNRVSHAYLFTGPRGIGKTSIARILAYEVNQLPYDESATHLDIIEIDAASNRRIDEVRDLREKVHIAPTSAKYKVYIIDEVHMLTREAFNALLKTLEEPPAHVIFILATTEVHKLPETIISRTQHFSFKPINSQEVAAHLATIAKQEKIQIDEDALKLIAEHGGGSFRDSISMLDQARNMSDKISKKEIESMLGVAPAKVITSLIEALSAKDPKNLITTLKATRDQGIDPSMLTKQLSQTLRENILHNSNRPEELLRLVTELIEVPSSADPYAALEVRLLQVVFNGKDLTAPVPSEPKPQSGVKPKTPPESEQAAPPSSPQKKADTTTKPEAVDTPPPKKTSGSSKKVTADQWPEVINEVKRTYNTLYGILRMAKPSFDDTSITLTLAFAFHQKRLNEPKNRQVIADAIEKVCSATPEIICVVGSASVDTPTPSESLPDVPNKNNPESLGTISNIFGGGELLES